jgi:pyrroline-5-carboxylate reductase
MVTSPGGTTAEGLLKLEEGELRAVLIQAVVAAYEKAQQLGKEH